MDSFSLLLECHAFVVLGIWFSIVEEETITDEQKKEHKGSTEPLECDMPKREQRQEQIPDNWLTGTTGYIQQQERREWTLLIGAEDRSSTKGQWGYVVLLFSYDSILLEHLFVEQKVKKETIEWEY